MPSNVKVLHPLSVLTVYGYVRIYKNVEPKIILGIAEKPLLEPLSMTN